MSKTFRKLTTAQLAVFEQIATGNDAGHNRRTLQALLERKLIVEYDETLAGYPPVTAHRFFVPIGTHHEWCQWCAEQPDEEIEEAES